MVAYWCGNFLYHSVSLLIWLHHEVNAALHRNIIEQYVDLSLTPVSSLYKIMTFVILQKCLKKNFFEFESIKVMAQLS